MPIQTQGGGAAAFLNRFIEKPFLSSRRDPLTRRIFKTPD
jgi:hypothetical protein